MRSGDNRELVANNNDSSDLVRLVSFSDGKKYRKIEISLHLHTQIPFHTDTPHPSMNLLKLLKTHQKNEHYIRVFNIPTALMTPTALNKDSSNTFKQLQLQMLFFVSE